MEFIKYVDSGRVLINYSGRILIKPKYEQDMPIFKHCSEGYISVTPAFFYVTVKPLLQYHGVFMTNLNEEEIEPGSTPDPA